MPPGGAVALPWGTRRWQGGGSSGGTLLCRRDALLWGREWGRRWGGTGLGGSGCCTHIPLSPSAALSHHFTWAHPCQRECRDGAEWQAVPPGWYLPWGGSQSGTRDKGSQPLSQPASTCCGYIPIPAALEGQRPWGETCWCLQQRLGSQDQGFPELKGRRYPRGTACHHLPRSPAGKRR